MNKTKLPDLIHSTVTGGYTGLENGHAPRLTLPDSGGKVKRGKVG